MFFDPWKLPSIRYAQGYVFLWLCRTTYHAYIVHEFIYGENAPEVTSVDSA